jgi:hypothetical protein
VYTNCCHAWQPEGSPLLEHAGEPVKNWLLSWSEKAFATCPPLPPDWPFSVMPELTPVNVPLAREISPDTTAE